MNYMYHIQFENDLISQHLLDHYTAKIPDARYQLTDMKNMVAKQHHLIDKQKEYLLDGLHEKYNLFDGVCAMHPQKKVDIDIEADAKPVRLQLYPMPCQMCTIFQPVKGI